MGRLSPQEIRDQEFKQSPLGYSKDQVHDFLDKMADELETLIKESNEIHAENKEARLALTAYKNVEESLKETLLLAQNTAQETLNNARGEADNILRKANIDKEALLFEAHQNISDIQNEIRRLLGQRDAILMKLKNVLRSNLVVLEEEFSKDQDEEFPGEAQVLGDEQIVDFSKNDMTVEDLTSHQPEPEIVIPEPEDLNQE